MPFHGAINQFMRSRYREEYGLPRSKPTDRCYGRATIAARSRPLWFDGQELIIQSVSLVLSKISKVFQPSLLCPIVSPLGSVQILRREV